jgi:Protein of unknown function (DUF3570)
VVIRVLKVDAAVTKSSCRLLALLCVFLLAFLCMGVPRSAAAATASQASPAEGESRSSPEDDNGSAAKAERRAAAKAKRLAAAKAKRLAAAKAKRLAAAKAKRLAVAKAKKGSAARRAPVSEDEDVQPEKSYLEEAANPEPAPPAAKPAAVERESPPTVEPSRTEPSSTVEPPSTVEPSPADEPSPTVEPSSGAHGGPAAHVSLETSGYSDTDHVSVLSPTVAVGLADEVAGWSVNGHYLVDVVSTASVDIVSTASPHWVEVRHVGGASGSIAFDPITVGASAVVSKEPDYLSITGGVTLSIDLLEKNLTPYLAFSREQDSIGRTDLPHEYWKSKHVTNLQLGLTAVLSRSTIGSVQLDGSFERGYLAKPYRYVPLFAPGQGPSIPAGASIDDVNQLRLSLRPDEQVPNSRDRYALSGHLAHRGGASTLRLDERLYADDWGLLAATSEIRYILDVSRRLELWPHLRHHIQGAANFWQRAYEAIPGPDGSLGVPVFRAGDRELGPLQTIVVGAGARLKVADPSSSQRDLVLEIDVGRTRFSDALYIGERFMGYSTLAVEAVF